MKTYNEIIWSIIEFMSGFKVTDDNPLDPKLVGDKVNDVRITLIKQQLNQQRGIDDNFYQLCDVGIDKRDIDKETDLKQFFVKFPEIISGVGWDNIKYFGKKNMSENYNRRSMDGFGAASGRLWSRKLADYTLTSSMEALIRGEEIAKDIVMLAIFKNPMSLPGMTADDVYPTPDPYRLEMIVKQDIASGLGIPADETNDARHNHEQFTGQQQ